jgi:hypothetical protein
LVLRVPAGWILEKRLKTSYSAPQVRYRERDRTAKEKLPKLPNLPKYDNGFFGDLVRFERERFV